MDAPTKAVPMEAKNAEPAVEQPSLVEPMSVDANIRGGDEGEDICCGLAGAFCCYECCKCCC